MTGEPMQITLKPNAPSRSVKYKPIPVPFHFKQSAKRDIDRDIRMGVLQKKPQGEATTYCSQTVFTPKTNGEPRRTIDFQDLNDATFREYNHTPSPFNLVSTIPEGMLKTVLDAKNGFHSLLIEEESRKYTDFITEWGVYQYCRGPQGYHGTGDAYTRRFDDITSNEERYIRCVDDGLLYDASIETAFWHTFDHIKLCADNGVVFNREKFVFASEVVDFAGFEINTTGFRPSKHLIEAIKNFPQPQTVTDIRAWFGIVNQVTYSFSQGELMQPFRCLLEKNQKYYWNDALQQKFEESKKEIVRQIEIGVRTYDLNKYTCLATDWCKDGIGFSLTQKHCKCPEPADPNCGNNHWKIVFAGSKATNPAQKRYAPIEGECLAAAYGLERCRMYTLGCPKLILAVDHKPLTNILNNRYLDTIQNPRLRRLKEKTFPFRYDIRYIPGGSNAMKVSDALSRNAIESQEDSAFKEIEEAARIYATLQGDQVESITWRRVNEEAAVDEECIALARLIIDGFPSDKSHLPTNLQLYHGMKDELYLVDNVPFKGSKMLIPKYLRSQVLDGLHAGNQGVTGMLANARSHFFWPGLDAAIRQLRAQCKQCNEQAPSQQSEPMIMTPPPEYPFEKAVADLLDLEGHTFVAYADRFSGWLEVERLPSSAFKHLQKVLLRYFSVYGVPTEISDDGGPPFNSQEFRSLLKRWDINHRLSSVAYPQSNGRAEAAVKSAKRILLGNINPMTGALDTESAIRAIMTHRSTPAQGTGVSPAELLFGRNIRDHLPRAERKLRQEWQEASDLRAQALARRAVTSIEKQGQELSTLRHGDSVQIQNQYGNHPKKWTNTGIVAEVLPNRQYQVVVDGSRRITLRNRKFLRKITPIARRNDSDPGIPQPQKEVATSLSKSIPSDVLPHEFSKSAPDNFINQDLTNHVRVEQPDVEQSSVKDQIVKTQQNIETSASQDRSDESSLPRRSTRIRTQTRFFTPRLSGKSHV